MVRSDRYFLNDIGSERIPSFGNRNESQLNQLLWIGMKIKKTFIQTKEAGELPLIYIHGEDTDLHLLTCIRSIASTMQPCIGASLDTRFMDP